MADETQYERRKALLDRTNRKRINIDVENATLESIDYIRTQTEYKKYGMSRARVIALAIEDLYQKTTSKV